MSGETDVEIYASLTDLDFEFNALRYISLTELAEDLGKSPLSYLRKVIKNRKDVFVRLRGNGAIIEGKKLEDYHKISLQVQLWRLPRKEIIKMMFEKPPWVITSIFPPDIVIGNPKLRFTVNNVESVDENDLFLVRPPTDESVNQTTDETEHQAIKKIGKRSNKELHRIFWRAFTSLRDEHGFEPKSKEVWEIIHDELKAEDQLREKKEFPPIRTYDPHDHIEIINSVHDPKPKLQWLITGSDTGISRRISEQGTFSFSTLSSLLTRLKKNPPKV